MAEQCGKEVEIEVPDESLEITENGTYNVLGYTQVVVNVEAE